MTHPLACGMRTFLMLAIHEHRKTNGGAMPKLFVLHHSTMAQLAKEDQQFIAAHGGAPDYAVDLETGRHYFMGVQVIRLRHGWPSMMTARNSVEVL